MSDAEDNEDEPKKTRQGSINLEKLEGLFGHEDDTNEQSSSSLQGASISELEHTHAKHKRQLTEEEKEKIKERIEKLKKKKEKQEKKHLSDLIKKKNELERYRRNDLRQVEDNKKKEIMKLAKVMEKVHSMAEEQSGGVNAEEVEKKAKKEKEKVAKLNQEAKAIKTEIDELELEMAKMEEINEKLQVLNFNGDNFIEKIKEQLTVERRKNEMLSRNFTKLKGGVKKLKADAAERKKFCDKEKKKKNIFADVVSKIGDRIETSADHFEDALMVPEILEQIMTLRAKYKNISMSDFE